jgi:hypothetical protein
MFEPSKKNGWDMASGSSSYVEGAGKGRATLLSATGYGQTTCVVLMTNTERYQHELAGFIGSIELSRPAEGEHTAVAGIIWEGSTSEKFVGSGTMTGYSTGGYFTGQYKFNADGTYRFINVLASAYLETNSLLYETGKYSVSGNRLTITPVSGVNEEWSVVGGPIKIASMSDVQIRKIKEHWGKKLKSEKRKLENVSYTFRVEYMNGNHANALILEYEGGHNEREGNGKIAYYFETPAAKSITLPEGIK